MKYSPATRLVIAAAILLLSAFGPTCYAHDSQQLRIALVQMDSGQGRLKNLEKIESFAAKAGRQGAQIICFPEMSITGYAIDRPDAIAEVVPGPSSKILSNIAVANRIIVLAGLIEKEKDKYFITQVVAFTDGRIESYRKTHLGRRERRTLGPGESLPVFRAKTDAGQEICFAIGICYDMHFPEIATVFSLKGAQIIFSPHASPLGGERRLEVWNRYMGARAYDNTLYIAACNHIDHAGEKGRAGGAAVWGPTTGKPLQHQVIAEENILFCDLDLASLKRMRDPTSKVFYLKDRRESLYFGN